MNDTSIIVREKLTNEYSRRSGEEKLLMALSMFETVRAVVLASLPDNLSSSELRKELFLRFYVNDFNDETKAKILEQL